MDLVALILQHGVAFAGKLRLVDLERVDPDQAAVDHDAVARLDQDDVVLDDLLDRQLDALAVAPGLDVFDLHGGELVLLAFGGDFLEHAQE